MDEITGVMPVCSKHTGVFDSCGGRLKVLRTELYKAGGGKRLTKCERCGRVKFYSLSRSMAFLGWRRAV